ncbi:unnamed protein product [Tilletia controversa]|uniref:Uncharacterized protein n=1 Tax=Tilletia controversa TaxID=13291 RepID=A0A8X7MZ34_9BASI|nr:hypothetical protein CF328_g2601 [Tilletia controversa]KAE8253149.1 hypothetical protein A4X06_0g1658 [Tilletia controversa]CAD6909522.1 unnamed protein product [Tilletia controversa]CAD6975035.1 unnamed protein product [Tilletia controversa]
MFPGQRSAFPRADVGQPNPFTSGPTTSTASIQVHYLWVRGRYRDLSTERGLGLAAEAHSLGPIAELGDNSDHSGSRPASAHLNTKAGAAPTDRLGDRKINPFLDIRNFTSDSAARAPARNAGVHGARHGSLRSYAADRLKTQELLESRISRTTDVERLKWEAKSALLNNTHSLAVLLFARAGSLGSISSCLTLTKIYASGVTRGTSPRIIVIRRDPLRALAWDLEAFRLLQRRLEPSKYGSAGYSQSTSGSEAWSAETPQGLEETFRCSELLIRLLRTTQAGVASLSSEPLVLPNIKTQQRLKSAQASKDAPARRAEVRLLWDEIAVVVRWLETRLERSVALARHRASQDHVAELGPDDDFDHDETAEYLEALAVQLAYLRAVQSLRTVLQIRSKEAIRAAKERWAQSLAAASSSHCPAGMDDIAPLAEAGLAFIHALPDDGWHENQQDTFKQAFADYSESLQEGLSELTVPTISDEIPPEEQVTKNTQSTLKVKQHAADVPDSKSRPEVSKHPETRKLEKRRSLQEVPPVDLASVSDAARTKQINLTQRLVGASQPAVAGVVSVEARGQQHIPRNRGSFYHDAADQDFGHARAPSTAGLTTASFVGNRLASPSVILLENGSIAATNKELLLPHATRDLEGFTFPRQGRPSSVVSDTPSLLFPRSGDELSAPEGEVEKSPDTHAMEKPARKHLDRKRVVSMYGLTPASGSKATSSSAAGGFPFPSDPQQTGSPPSGPNHAHRSPSETTAQDALENTLRNTPSNASLANPATRSLFLSPSHGRSMSGQATEHLRKLRQQDAASTHSRMNSDAMSTLSKTLRHRNPSDAGRARPPSLLMAPSVAQRSVSTAPLPASLQAAAAPTLSRSSTLASASSVQASRSELTQATSALGSLRKIAPALPRSPDGADVTSVARSTSHLELGGGPSAASSLSRASGKAVKARPPPLSRTFAKMDPTSRPDSGPQSPSSPRLPDGDSPSESAGGPSPRATPASSRLATHSHSHSRGTSSSSHAQQLDLALAEAEARSRLHTEGTCSMCKTQCENAPLTRTGQRFCSRECRMEVKRLAAAEAKGSGAEGVGQGGPPSKAKGEVEGVAAA